MHDQQAELAWNAAGTPVSTRFDDPYFSLEDGLAETRHTFLAGNGLPERFKPGFHVAELGFGTGLNFLATLDAFRASGCGGVLHYTSFEAYPMRPPEIARALQAFPTLDPTPLTSATLPLAEGADYRLEVVVGDARTTLPVWQHRADAWFLDGFAPAKNPELWEASLMAEVAAHTAPRGTFATYTAAGHVRRALEAAGFAVERAPGFGRKRHMSRGRLA
ncbi:tRNA (5-methylaminomethyl-2-thiouridine)(34)-methyltransferase MnmD [Vannielia sp.]|uniref:tRNA (5-methylaminomethyl-2-thiouridine)(34)-methyltransferase MnmD n=1 Tax=Vannielia sp. TaxID=2813045 RepID=UPI0026215184|nr:tRNA (5-methylaminomethyl-2-thiouridine)(34)-methyltransferase MnmD [Vannielia sp.]MDF1873507.1 tRNA (5-methylaminomethyl-2-thiouridine)(34)-methyltransferase MnmD [Vannielia sp.]